MIIILFCILGLTCQDHEFACSNRKCIHKGLKCNYEDNCGDNSDEMHCRGKFKICDNFFDININVASFLFLNLLTIVLFQIGGRCPTDYPYAFLWGSHCCKQDLENGTDGYRYIHWLHGLSLYEGGYRHPESMNECDGSPLSFDSLCCKNNQYQKCSNPEGCQSHRSMCPYYIVFM